jgi:hypothetical protein
MQYWIMYQAGVGGDGFGNLLEHADNVFPADEQDSWRIHYRDNRAGVLDRPVRFYQAHWALDPKPFRFPTLPESTILNPVYVDLIKQQKNTIITSHYSYFTQIDKFEYQDIVKQDQVLINLYSDRVERVYQDLNNKRPESTIKNLSLAQFEIFFQRVNSSESSRTDYAIHIDIEKAWRDWDYLNNCLNKLGINLNKKFYDHYLTYIDNL